MLKAASLFFMRRERQARCHARGRMYALTLLLVLLIAPVASRAQTVDMFGRTASGATAATKQQPLPTKDDGSANSCASGCAFAMPAWARRVAGEGIRWQSWLNARLQDAIQNARPGAGALAALTVSLLSFAYGVLHALGPGHGKTVVGTYLASHPTRIGEAVLLSAWSATAQALSAIMLVGGAALLAHRGLEGVLTQAASLELVSYAALLCVGVWTAWSVAARRDCCALPRARLAPSHGAVAACEATADELPLQASYLGSKLAVHRRGARVMSNGHARGPTLPLRQILLAGLAVGIRPCAGAIFVLITALDQRHFETGVVATFAMSAGVALTICTIGLMSRGVNRALSARTVLRRMRIERVHRRVALSGAFFIIMFAAWQILALVAGWRSMALV